MCKNVLSCKCGDSNVKLWVLYPKSTQPMCAKCLHVEEGDIEPDGTVSKLDSVVGMVTFFPAIKMSDTELWPAGLCPKGSDDWLDWTRLPLSKDEDIEYPHPAMKFQT